VSCESEAKAAVPRTEEQLRRGKVTVNKEVKRLCQQLEDSEVLAEL